MDDSCAVCAEALEWVAYGPCGHREVCSTCVARLRFICDDRRCCLCKTECNIVFVTKALGDYTRIINDFSVFPSDPTDGKAGPYWYHEDTQAYFDDLDHYKMVKAMCRLSCSVCDKIEEPGNEASKRKGKFRNIEQLKSHLFHRHRLSMCSLCLEGRKIFICEQKLYTRAQLNQHINTGDSEVDGSESERGGFMGHPMCEFCRNPFYGDNELYSHMSTEHYTCHICQRSHPGQYEYYKNYDDLEARYFQCLSQIHFRRDHFLCEDEACLAKKFIVFTSESEMKRHNAIEHGGHMSRSKRNAVLQIPTSFRFRRNNEQDRRRGRGRGFHPDSSDNQLLLAIQASFETANADSTIHDLPSNAQVVSDHGEMSEIDAIVGPFESLGTTDSEPSLRYRQALGQNSMNAPLAESSFPPLPMAPSSQQKLKHDSERLAKNTMAARLRRSNKGTVTVLNSAQAWPATSRPVSSSSSSAQSRCITNYGLVSSSSSSSSNQSKPATANGPAPSSYASSTQARPATVHGVVSASSSSSLWSSSSTSTVSHSTSAPNLVDSGFFGTTFSNFPPVSAIQKNKLPTSSQSSLKVEDVRTANKSLVERIRAALEFDEDKFAAFKEISAEYRQGLISTVEYLSYVHQFGLSHLVVELARLCPDAQKQKELIETYNASVLTDGPQQIGWGNSSAHLKVSSGSKKGKGKCVDDTDSRSKDMLADNIISTVRKLQSSYKPSEEAEVLLKDGYRAAKGKAKVLGFNEQAELSSASELRVQPRGQSESPTFNGGSNKKSGATGGVTKQRKKTSKFHRVRLGDGSAAAHLDLGHSDPGPDLAEETTDDIENSSEGLPVRGVWRNRGGLRLVATTHRVPPK
ncbi:hypothetical protein HHK36_026351 [Tetracentron sinense]|uniref:RING-type E3 ubiquitin transferase n=1 Tax=Tetracentron sinense TaxID=13715 RepID=A0A834YK77_TETSI|nr:hypothetical protein HHK36_026351 [Tetracentron sinense]